MTDQNGTRSRNRGPLLVPVAALGMVVLIFAGFVGFSSLKLRQDLRERVVQRYADIWEPIASFQIQQGLEDELLGLLDFEETIVYSLMSAQDIDGALGIQVFDSGGNFLAGAPVEIGESSLDNESVSRLAIGSPWAVFRSVDQGDGRDKEVSPEVELNIPIQPDGQSEFLYLARYFMDGREAWEELQTIDEELVSQASLAFASGSALVSLVLAWSFWRLRKANAEVAERAARLARANAELAMVAKTSAIGAIASHLIHGLKNPLAGIRAQLSENGRQLGDEEWEDTYSATERMQSMINEVVDVLKNEEFDEAHDLEGGEIANQLKGKYELKAQEKGLDFGVRSGSGIALSARDANIAKLIVSNLVENAIDATSVSGEVEVRIGDEDGDVVFSILDSGPGFSDTARKNLFSPVDSQKSAGAGIGLAISQQLARHLGARLELTRSSSSGSEIRLIMPSSERREAIEG